MLLQIRVPFLLFLLMFIAQSLSNVHSQQGRKFAIGRLNSPSNGKVSMDTKPEPHATTTTNQLMKIQKLVLVEKVKGNGGGDGGASRRSLSLHKRKEMPGFVAFTADYKPPRHHPPKNN